MRQTQTVQIKGVTFQITQLGAMQGRKVLLRAVRLIAPVISAKGDAEAMIAAVLNDISEPDLDYVCDVFSAATVMRMTLTANLPTSQVVPFNFDDHFAGNYTAMIEWLIAHLKLNFESFLAEIGATLATLQPAAPSPVEGSSSSPRG